MESALRFILDIIVWVLVPQILIIALLLIHSLSRKLGDKKHKSSTRAGFWAGFMLFVIVLIYQLTLFIKNGFPNEPIFKGFDLWLAITASAAIYFLFFGGKKIIPPEMSGWVVLVITFGCFYALFHYLFIRSFNEILLSLILGITFGILAHIASSPTLLHELLEFLKPQQK